MIKDPVTRMIRTPSTATSRNQGQLDFQQCEGASVRPQSVEFIAIRHSPRLDCFQTLYISISTRPPGDGNNRHETDELVHWQASLCGVIGELPPSNVHDSGIAPRHDRASHFQTPVVPEGSPLDRYR